MNSEQDVELDHFRDDIKKAIDVVRKDQHHPQLSEYQIQTVINLAEKRNCLSQLPTGSGKTWPIVSFPKILDVLRDNFSHNFPQETRVLYVVPLISIYHSLSAEMEKLNIPFQVMGAGSSTEINKSAKVLFISPERLLNKFVVKSIMGLQWSCVSIDEPHLALEWGLSKSKHQKPFREAFSKLNTLNSLGTVFEMHSATVQSIEMLFQLVGRKNSAWSTQVLVPDRSNLTYFLYEGKDAPDHIMQLPIIHLSLEEFDDGLTLVYVQSIQEGSEIFISIVSHCEENKLIGFSSREAKPNLPVAFLHSNLTEEKKIEIIEKASANELKILVATSAAGCGINLPIVRFVGWGLDRQPSGIIQSQGRTARSPFTGEGIVIWVHNPKLHGRRLPVTSKVREVLQGSCFRKTSNSWFSHGMPSDVNQSPPEFCCSLCMTECVEKSGCQVCKAKLSKYQPKLSLVNFSGFESTLVDFFISISLNQVTPSSSPLYSEDSLATEIVKQVRESQDLDKLAEFLTIFSLGATVTAKIVRFVRKSIEQLDLKSPEMLDTCESLSDSDSSDTSDSIDIDGEYFDSESE